MARGPKKSETLELRIPHGAKQAFMARCAAEGRGASEILRQLIDGYVQRPTRRAHKVLHLAAAAAIVLGAGAVALPTLAATAARSGYDSLDRDHNGALSLAELSALDANGDGAISYAEYRNP